MRDEFPIFDLCDHRTGNLRQADQKRKTPPLGMRVRVEQITCQKFKGG